MVTIKKISEQDLPMSLLLHADPSQRCIEKYLPESKCFSAIIENALVGACVTNLNEAGAREIYNIVVSPEKQKRGIGTQLLTYVIKYFSDTGEKKLELGTGTFGYQLLFYQRFGFRVKSIREDFFIENYSAPIYENGVQLKDMLRLALEL